MLNSLRFRLFLSYLFIVAVSVLVIGLALLLFLRTNAGIERIDLLRLTEANRSITRNDPPPDNANQRLLEAYIQQLAIDYNLRAMIVNRVGKVQMDSAVLNGEATEGDIATLDPITQASQRGTVRDSARQTWVYLVTPNGQGGQRLVLLALRTGPLQFLLENFLTPFVQATCMGVIVSLVMALLITYWLTQSLRKFSEAASSVAHGQINQAILPSGPSEIQTLAQSFNDMVTRVNASQQTQRDFVANVSHELKTPLTSIQGFSQAILDNATEPTRAAQIINDEAGRMRRLVDGLLDLARLDAGQAALQRAPTDLGPILQSVAEKLSLRANEKQVSLKVEIGNLPIIVADGDRLAQVFTNLLDNAIKHTPGSGTVTLTARPDSASRTVSVVVTDTGPGIPADDLSRIFERFYRVDKSRAAGHGYGIGLAITKEIVQAHSGAITAESVVGLGTKFTVRLPVSLSSDKTVTKRKAR